MNTKYFKFKKDNYNIDYIKDCVSEFRNGNIGIIPTDTVYGISCNCLNIFNIKKLYEIKNRNLNKPINILVSDIQMVNKFVKDIGPIEKKLMENFWPGPLTIIFNKSKIIPDILTSNLKTVGIRMPNNKICLDLISKLNIPLATSSANISNENSITNIANIVNTFDKKVDFILDYGDLEPNMPSTIVKVNNNKIIILREGLITINDINKILEAK